jgi:hypothetical protein
VLKIVKMSSVTAPKINIKLIVIAIVVFAAAALRLGSSIPNYSPLAALAVFAGAHLSKKWLAVIIPIAATWLSDFVLDNTLYAPASGEIVWFYGGFYWQYSCYAIMALVAYFLIKKVTVTNVVLASLGASLLFFVVTNFGVWATSGMYAKTFAGLQLCYTAAIPFFQKTILGDLVHSAVFFGGFALAQMAIPTLRPAKA